MSSEINDPHLVMVVEEPGLAESLTSYLIDQGIPAKAVPVSEPGVAGLGALVGMTPDAMGIYVFEEALVPQAKQLLQQVEEEHQHTPLPTGPVIVVCEACGKEAVFEPEQAGKVQDCPHCGAFLDVPDGTTWDNLDFGTPEEE